MSRILPLLTVLLACSLAACADDDKVQILVFQASPDAIEAGQSTKLVFSVEPATAKVTISGLGDMTGQTSASVSPADTTSYQLTATNGSATANKSVTITVGATSAAAIKVEPMTTTPTAGDQVPVTLTVLANNGKPAPGFRGTLRLTSTDAKAALPGDIAFTAADSGAKQVMVTLKTAGGSTLFATDTTSKASVSGAATLTVQPAAAKTYQLSPLPSSTVAGQAVTLTITALDVFGNVATAYGGSVQLVSTDATDVLPPAGALTAGVRTVSLTFIKTGSHVAQVQDVATVLPSAPTSSVTVTPAAPKVVVTLPADANSGYPVTVGVTIKDVFDNAFPNYAGTVSFASTDAGSGASAPGDIVFAGTEGGIGSGTATFVTPGAQTLSATGTAPGKPTALGNAVARVHGLVYTAPTTGRVRLVVNAAQSTPKVVQLDLVANERLLMSSLFTVNNVLGGPGSFTAGMNLPLDTTRVTGDNTLFTPGAALPLGTGTPAVAAAIGSDHVLYTAVSRKRAAGTPVFFQGTEVPAGGLFYSVRLKLQPTGTVGPVFDGAQPMAMYRASVRDQYGDDFVRQFDFGVGKLEVR